MKPRVIFEDENHIYSINDKTKRILESVSGVTDTTREVFDKESAAILFAAKEIDKKMYNKLKKELGYGKDLLNAVLTEYDDMLLLKAIAESFKIKWNRKGKNSSSKGTIKHKEKERESIDKGMEVNPQTKNELPVIHWEMQYDNESLESLKDVESGCYNEMIVWNEDYGIAGTPDRVFFEGKDVWIRDWKTDEELKFESFYWRGKGHMSLNPPLNHMPKSNISIYSIKMSVYGLMLEMEGYKIKGLEIDHIVFNKYNKEEVERIDKVPIPYKPFEAKILIDTWLNQQKK